MTAEQLYFERLQSRVSPSHKLRPPFEHPTYAPKPDSNLVKAIYWHRDEDYGIDRTWTVDSVLAQCQEDVAKGTPSILLVENISPELIGMLGVAFAVEESCWMSYMCNPDGQSAWEALFRGNARSNIEQVVRKAGWQPEPARPQMGSKGSETMSMDFTGQLGTMSVFAQSYGYWAEARHHRLEYFDPQCGTCLSTNMTYFVLSDTICIFLVDACGGEYFYRNPRNGSDRPLLFRVPCSDAWDGLIIPQYRAVDHHFSSTFAVTTSFLSMVPHRQALMTAGTPKRVVDPITLSYYICASLHRSNLRILRSQLHDISFKQLQSDDADGLERLNKILHQRREEIVVLQTQIAHTVKSINPQVRQHLARLSTEAAGDSPLPTFDEVHKESVELLRFLMDTFQLLTSSINIKDAKLSIEQAARATRLTQLAAVYLPLTLVTGIFGMNIREITRDDPSWWACIVTLVFVVLLTSSLFWVMSAWKQYGPRILHEVRGWIRLHHCGKQIWKWVRRKWYDLWKR